MKKNILLFTAIAGMSYLILSSYVTGPAASFQNRSGVNGSPSTCGSSGCHGSATGPTVTITVDSGSTSVPVTQYRPGASYTIKIHGAGSSNTKFGFQFASVKGTSPSQSNAGTTSGFPTNVAKHTFATIDYVEQTAALNAASAGAFDVSFTWTAPSSGTGNVKMYCTLNSVNGNGNADNSDVSGNTSITLTEMLTTGVNEVVVNTDITAFPNPVTNSLNLQTANAGIYSVRVFDLNGRTMLNGQMNLNGTANINTSNWATGFYQIVVEKDGNRQIIPLVKQ